MNSGTITRQLDSIKSTTVEISMNSGTFAIRNKPRIYDSRNFNELGNLRSENDWLKSTTVEISMNSGTRKPIASALYLRQ